MESADSFRLGPNQLPDIPEEMPTIPMPRANRRRLSKSQPVRSAPPPRSPPVQPTTSGTSDNSRTNATHNDQRYKKILM